MHYHCEIVIPPTEDIKGSIEAVMEPFDENGENRRRQSFWDYWVIGGRYAGEKLQASLDPAKLEEFNQWLKAEKVTVSGLQWGKQELSPASQIAKVDSKWNEMFPSDREQPCPLFQHSNDQFDSGDTLSGDICKLSEVPANLACYRVIFAKPSYESEIEAEFMLSKKIWNGCNHMPVAWDGTFGEAVKKYEETLFGLTPEAAARLRPSPDWLVVTVDYHS